MRLPAPAEQEPLRARFKRLPPPLLELMEACLQVLGAGGIGWGAHVALSLWEGLG